MGHADLDTTMKYLHFAPRAGDADLVAEAFPTEVARRRRSHAALVVGVGAPRTAG